MPKFLPVTYTRLRQLAGDRRLHVTTAGQTTSGYLAEVTIEYTSGDVPNLHLELEESEHDIFGEGIDAARIDIRADRLLTADTDTLRFDATTSYAWHQLEQALTALRSWMRDGEAPPCGHEDVIETPQMGSTTVPGICMWCPTPLVKDEHHDTWVPVSEGQGSALRDE
ncbi:hypothetical protein AB0G67_40310 [Streptomyces sp. NPDC021056]|uniref:hypothetical protein n=1 Tax=Streptomyces sp. NPDC021056 TaxID=3155012 RepID=UPI0033FDC72C